MMLHNPLLTISVYFKGVFQVLNLIPICHIRADNVSTSMYSYNRKLIKNRMETHQNTFVMGEAIGSKQNHEGISQQRPASKNACFIILFYRYSLYLYTP